MNVIFHCNPFKDSRFEFIRDDDKNLTITKEFNSTFRISKIVERSTLSSLMSLITSLGFVSLTLTVKQPSYPDQLIELFRTAVYQFFGLEITSIQIAHLLIKEQTWDHVVRYFRLVPFYNDKRIYISEELLISFFNSFEEIFLNDRTLVLNDSFKFYSFISDQLESKSIFPEGKITRTGDIVSSNGKIFNNFIDKVNDFDLMFKKLNYFSLDEFRFDSLLLLMLELIKVFRVKVISSNDLIFQSNELIDKNWIINSSLQLIKNRLPNVRVQTNVFIQDSDNSLRAKIKLCGILSYYRLNIPFDFNDIVIHEDYSIQVPVYNLKTLNDFTDYFNQYFEGIEHWSILLCPSLGQAITIRNSIIEESYLNEVYIVTFNSKEYLIIPTNVFDRKMIEFPEDIKSTIIDEPLIDRGFDEMIEYQPVQLHSRVIHDEDLFKLIVEGQIVMIDCDEKQVKRNEEEYQKPITNLWILFHLKNDKKISELYRLIK
jgi:hypothetical protein